jgi:hypothetical protein
MGRHCNTSALFWSKVSKSDGCWEWMGGKDKDGYGKITYMWRGLRAHRLSWELTYGVIPQGLDVLHRCDNPPCVRPDHLFLGTHGDNNRDMKEKGRTATGIRNGSYTHPELRPRGNRHGSRTHPECLRRGEMVNTAKLAGGDVVEIRNLYARGKYTQKQIALLFGVKQPEISSIIRRETWTHV